MRERIAEEIFEKTTDFQTQAKALNDFESSTLADAVMRLLFGDTS